MAGRRLAAAMVVAAFVASVFALVPAPAIGDTDGPAEGEVLAFGDVLPVPGSAGEGVVDAAATVLGAGWWAVDGAGMVTPSGDAVHHGDLRGRTPDHAVVGMAATPSGRGYWLVATDGGVFSFGDARFFGSTGAIRLNEPIVAVAATPSGRGYWLVASDGGVFTFGDARFGGSAAGTGATVTDAAASPGGGYWVLAADGTVRAFGGAHHAGDARGRVRDGAAVGLMATASGGGYRFAVGPVRDTVTVWQPGGLRGESQLWAEDVARAAGARAVLRHRANLDLDAGSGWRLPLSLVTYEPSTARPLLGPSGAAAIGRGEVVLGTASAALRHASIGSVLTFVGSDGRLHPRRVGAVVPDARLAWAEVALATGDAASMGVNRPFAVDLWGAPRPSLDGALATAPPPPTRLGIERAWEPPDPDSTLANVPLKRLAGEVAYRHGAGDGVALDPSWVRANIATERVPALGSVTCHRAMLPALRGALTEVVQAGLAGGLGRYGGCHHPRLIRGGDSGGFLSRHSYGVAVDLNITRNAFGGRVEMDPRIVAIFRRWGFAWGGTWVRADGMHFEYRG